MYKLNILSPKEFFNLQTPVNFLSKRRNYANIKEIKRSFKDEQGRPIRFSSLSHSFWFRNFERPTISIHIKHQRSYTPTRMIHYGLKNPIFIKRKDMKEKLQQFTSRASTTSPSKKQKRCHNIFCQHPYRQPFQKKLLEEKKSPQKQKTYTNIDDSYRNGSFFSQNSSDHLLRTTKILHPKLPTILQVKVKPYVDHQDSEQMNTSIHKGSQDNYSPIIEKQPKPEIHNTSSTRNRFLNDSYRLYGLNTEIKKPKNKLQLKVEQICKSTESKELHYHSEGKSPPQENSNLPKPSLSQNKLYKLLKQNQYLQLDKNKKKPIYTKSPKKSKQHQQKEKLLVTSYFDKDTQISSHFFKL